MDWIIYVLKNPRTNEVRYVGFTSQTLAKRLQNHLSDACRCRGSYRDRWILSLLSIGLTPLAEIIEAGSGDGWKEAERRWIGHYRAEGAKLVNTTDGGEGVIGWWSPEARSAMARKWQACRSAEERSANAAKWALKFSAEERSAMARRREAAKTREQYETATKKRVAKDSRERRSERTRRWYATLSPEQRRAHALHAQAARSAEERHATAVKREAAIPAEERSERARRRQAAKTPEQRSAITRKGHIARAAKKARHLVPPVAAG